MSFSCAHFSILTLPISMAKCHRNSSSSSSLANFSLKGSRSSKTCTRGRDSASSLSIKKEYLRYLHVGRLASASLKSNLRGYPAASFEASLHNLLTWASLRRVPTHCTCEKTTVAISKLGSNVGWYASILRLPLRSCMVALRGREWEDVVALLARPQQRFFPPTSSVPRGASADTTTERTRRRHPHGAPGGSRERLISTTRRRERSRSPRSRPRRPLPAPVDDERR